MDETNDEKKDKLPEHPKVLHNTPICTNLELQGNNGKISKGPEVLKTPRNRVGPDLQAK